MNQNRKEELLTRWMDDVLSEEELLELEPVLVEDPNLRLEREDYANLREELKGTILAEVEPPYPDFFNVHLERLVNDVSRSGQRTGRQKSGLSRWWTWWIAPAATAAVVAAFILGMNMTNRNVPAPWVEVATAYSPVENVRPTVEHDDSLDATLIVLTGLDDVPDENLIGWSGSRVEAEGFFVTATQTY